MRARLSPALVLVLAFAGAMAAEPLLTPSADVPLGPAGLLDRAFEARYTDTAAQVEIRIDDGHGSKLERRLTLSTKRIGGRMHSLCRLRSPEYLRGMTLLNIEQQGGAGESFVFMPALGRVRRISSAQRSDAFLGSDLTFEDFQRFRASNFEVSSLDRGEIDGETVLRLEGRPHHESPYERMEFAVAESDRGILEIRYYRSGAKEPYRIIEMPRASQRAQNEYVVPTRIRVRNLLRGSQTEVLLLDLKIQPRIEDSMFSVSTLVREAELPAVAR